MLSMYFSRRGTLLILLISRVVLTTAQRRNPYETEPDEGFSLRRNQFSHSPPSNMEAPARRIFTPDRISEFDDDEFNTHRSSLKRKAFISNGFTDDVGNDNGIALPYRYQDEMPFSQRRKVRDQIYPQEEEDGLEFDAISQVARPLVSRPPSISSWSAGRTRPFRNEAHSNRELSESHLTDQLSKSGRRSPRDEKTERQLQSKQDAKDPLTAKKVAGEGAILAVSLGVGMAAKEGAVRLLQKTAKGAAVEKTGTALAQKAASSIAQKATTFASRTTSTVAAKVAGMLGKRAAMIAGLAAIPIIGWILSGISAVFMVLLVSLELRAENFEKCHSNEFDFANWPKWLKAMISSLPAIGELFQGIGDKLCFRNGSCPEGMEKGGLGICYPRCPEGYKSDGATRCYRAYPEFENNGMHHSLTSITKKLITSPGKPLTQCAPDEERDGALCYPNCKEDHDGNGPICWQTCGKDREVGALCRQYCAEGWREVAGVCWQKARSYVPTTYSKGSYSRGAGRSLGCEADQWEHHGLCYEKCPHGYRRDTLGVCAQICPEGAHDFGAGCSRQALSRGAGMLPFGVRVKKRIVELGEGKKF